MTTYWLVDAIGFYVTTVGALLIFLSLYRAPRFAEVSLTAEEKIAYAKYQRRVTLGVGLLAGWVVVQYLNFVLL
jgi:hypothetical protein